jgi:transketolase N-terminal domain/subunit
MAISAKMDKRSFLTHVVLGGGELQEGIVTEAAEMAAAHCCPVKTLNIAV